MEINKTDIKKHIEFLTGIDTAYSDGRLEVSRLNSANNYAYDDNASAVDKAIEINSNNRSAYIVGATLDPDIAPFGRSSDTDFYMSNFVWADIDEPHNAHDLKALYKDCPPNAAVVTARHPHRRIQFWWKLSEAIEDPETITEALKGICQALNGDPAVTNPTSLMRIGGTINYPSEKKLADGRVVELTEFVLLHNESVPIEKILHTFPCHDIETGEFFEAPQITRTTTSGNALSVVEKIVDGRDKYMSDMIYASIISLAGEAKRWPEAQEVFDDCWPVYERKVEARSSKGLSAEGRGHKLMQQKITAKLRQFTGGRIKKFPTIESVVSTHVPKTKPLEVVCDEPKKEVGKTKKKKMFYVPARDITFNPEDNTLVKDVLGQGEMSVIYGASNCGKTFFMTDIALSIARGEDWNGHRVSQGGVMYAALEGARGLSGRFKAYCDHYNLQNPDFPFAFMPCGLDFYSDDSNIDEFIDLIKSAQDDIGDPNLIVIDTLARAMAGGDENSGQDMGRLVHYSDIIRAETKAHLSFVHHSGKDKALGARGHSSLRAAVDTEIEVSREEDSNQSVIKFVKQREIEMIKDKAFELERIVIGTNNFSEEITSCVVKVVDVDTQEKVTTLSPQEKFIYECIIDAIETKGSKITPMIGMQEVKAVSYEDFYKSLEKKGYKELYDKDGNVTSKNIKTATNVSRIRLRSKGKISFNADCIWMLN